MFIFYWVRFLIGIKNMNSTFTVINTLVKSNMGEKCLINFSMNVSTKALRDYLECANIYKGTSPKKKTNLIELIIYGCITEKLNKKRLRKHIKKTSKSNIEQKQHQSKMITWIWKY